MAYSIFNKLSKIIVIFFLVYSVYSCRKEKVAAPDQSTYLNYFPLDTGYWVEYVVDSVVHLDDDDVNEVDTAILSFHFYIREEVDTPFIDGENQKAFVITRYKRENDTLPWILMNVWTAKANSYSAQRVEDNVRYIRLKFPINSSDSWNGNAFNFFQEEDYTYTDLYEPYNSGAMYFDSTITVLQNDFVSLINKIYKKEIYARNAGMLYKELDSVNTMNTVNGMIILNGLEYKLNITGYGH